MAREAELERSLLEFERTHNSFAAHTWAEADRRISDIYGYKIKNQCAGEPNRVLFGGASTVIDDVRFTSHRSSCAYEGVLDNEEDHFGTGLLIEGVTDIEDPQLGSLRPRNEHEARVYHMAPGTKVSAGSASISAFGVFIPAKIVEQKARSFFDDAVASKIQFTPFFDTRSLRGGGFHNLLVHLLSVLGSSHTDFSHPMMKGMISDLIASSMLSSLDCGLLHNTAPSKFEPVPRNVQRAEDYMRAYADEPITLEILAQQAGCSGRALQNAFKTFRRKTPIVVLREIRLDKARIDLLADSGTITGIAYRWGFNNLGRFARLYKERFGELPSETLRKS